MFGQKCYIKNVDVADRFDIFAFVLCLQLDTIGVDVGSACSRVACMFVLSVDREEPTSDTFFSVESSYSKQR